MHPQRVLLFFFVVLFGGSAYAGNVIKTKGKKVYIVFDKSEGGTFAKDDLFNITDANGKKIGVVELKKIKGLKAIGQLKKGRATKGNGTLFRSVGKKTKKMKTLRDAESSYSSSDDSGESDYQPAGSTRFGLQFGYGMAKQDVLQDNGTSAQSGSSMAFKGIMDYPLFGSFHLHGGLGAEMFNVSGTGTSAETGETDVEISTKITFVSADVLLRYYVIDSGFKLFLHGGAGILHPMSKSSDSIDPATITSLAIGEFGAGVEFKMGGYSIPLDLTYYMFPDGDTVSTSVISVKAGVYF